MAYETIDVAIEGDRATVTLDRPAKRNAMTTGTFAEIEAAFGELAADGALSVVTLRGAGGDFSAGVDVSGVPGWAEAKPLAVRDALADVHAALRTIEAVDLPVIAACEGYVLGGGLELALCCDLRVAHADATFGLPEATLGLAMDLGGAQKLPGIVGEGLTKRLIMTGEPIDAARAYEIGLVGEVAPADGFDAAVDRLADRLAELPRYVLGMAKRQVHSARPAGLDAAIERSIHDAIGAYHEEETQRRVRAFIDG